MNILCVLALAIVLYTGAADRLIDASCRCMTVTSLTKVYVRMLPATLEKAREAAMTVLHLRPDLWYVKDSVMSQSPR